MSGVVDAIAALAVTCSMIKHLPATGFVLGQGSITERPLAKNAPTANRNATAAPATVRSSTQSSRLQGVGIVTSASVMIGRGRGWRRRFFPRGRSDALVVVHAAGGDTEAAKLAQEAAKIRAEAQELEKEKVNEQRINRAKDILGSKSAVGPQELQVKLKEVAGFTVSPGEVGDIMKACFAGDKLGIGDLASAAFDEALSQIISAQDARLNAELAKRKQELAEEAAREKMVSSITDVFAGGEEDSSGPAGRVLACLPYLLPLIDGLPYGGALPDLVPFLMPLYVVVSPILTLKSVIPFGTFIFLIGFQFLCRNPELPNLLRYNLRQACVIDIFILLPQFIAGFTGFQLPDLLDVPVFILMVISIVYSVGMTALGKTPNKLGFISEATERGL
eukprot:TRINITY_DN24221_c0_g2_i1.p1 TRINITY_DN24221_c0_g2~~TRINITY_DN24221_c0_g2_i1.p1  ORF type:complete len:391 (+),score=79.99 TRINITY_DN24221_c0_g2_i1:214-1386(+)